MIAEIPSRNGPKGQHIQVKTEEEAGYSTKCTIKDAARRPAFGKDARAHAAIKDMENTYRRIQRRIRRSKISHIKAMSSRT